MRLTNEYFIDLGWSRDKMRAIQLQGQIYTKDNWNMLYNFENNQISIHIKDPSKDEDFLKYLRTTSVSYLTIKTASEFKKLLKQLRIE